MGKGQIQPGKPHNIITGVKGTAGGSALDPGDVVITDAALTPDGFKGSDAATSLAMAGVNLNRVEDAETELDILIEGDIAVKSDGNIPVNSYIKTSTTKGVLLHVQGTDDPLARKGFFSGLHDRPVDGNGKLQDPQTKKDAVADDIIIVHWGQK